MKTLDQISTNLDSRRVPITKGVRIGGEYPYYGASGIVDYVADYIFDEDALLISEDGANLLARSTPIAFPASGKYWVNNHAHILKFENLTTQRLVELYLESTSLDEYITGAAQPKLNQKALNSIPIPVPPLPEQRRIVGLLDEAFAGIASAKANAEQNLHNARALFDSHLYATLLNKKWKWKTLGDLCHGVEYGSSSKSKKEGKVPVLRMGNIQDGHLDWENLVYTNDKDEIEKYLLKYNDVLFNRTNSPELVGKTAIYKSEMPAIFAGYLIRIHRKEDLLDGDFLNYFLNSQIALDYGKTVVISSVNQANINGAKLKGYPIPTPSISDQRTIVKNLDAISAETQRLESIYKQKLAALEALKKSLLHLAFTGNL
ncbi:MAG: restriction endonuclease subunit S [Nitrospirales bacterium]|nr:restriction endonuclease subunit S [Nitrospirales bacterium]